MRLIGKGRCAKAEEEIIEVAVEVVAAVDVCTRAEIFGVR